MKSIQLSAGFSYDQPIDPLNPGKWVKIDENEWFTTWELEEGNVLVRKTEYKDKIHLLEHNQQRRNESDGQRWGDGKIIGQVPLNEYFGNTGLAEARKQGDTGYIKRWWNNSDNNHYRTFKGTI